MTRVENLTEKAALSVDEGAHYIGIGRAYLYRLMDRGEIKAFHIGSRRLLLREELDRYLQARMAAEHGGEVRP